MANNKRELKKVGVFTLSGMELRISDPGYDKDTWCAHVATNCKPGKYTAYVNENHFRYTTPEKPEPISYKRVASLYIVHESTNGNVFRTIHLDNERYRWKAPWSEVSTDIGVDSGQAGFFDEAFYGSNDIFPTEGKCGYGDKWYSNCCDITLGEKGVGIVAGIGVNSESGDGDGSYSVYGHKAEDGQYDAFVLYFLPDDEETEWDIKEA